MTHAYCRFRAVSATHIDTLGACGYTAKRGANWTPVKGNMWKAGGWHCIKWNERTGLFTANAGSDVCWTEQICADTLAEGLDSEPELTRIDLCRDVVGLPVEAALILYFTGHRNDRARFEQNATGNTVYIGSRESSLLLRIYEKWHPQKSKRPPLERLVREWTAHGWTEREPVTRIEYECKRRMVERCMVGRDAGWNDCLARLRMLERPRHEYKKPSNAPTHPDWYALGKPSKIRLSSLREPPLLEKLTRAAEQAARRADNLNMSLEDYLDTLAHLASGRTKSDGVALDMSEADELHIRGERLQLLDRRRRGSVE